ncbi:MAG TPA: cyclase family protein [Candidatus Binatia bacterium]|jgi:kynurenine formamidase
MNFLDLTMPLNHRWMPDEGLPTAVKFFLGPKDHQEKGIVVGSDSGTSLALPSMFVEFRRTIRLDQVPVEKLFLRPAVVAHIDKPDEKEISKSDVEKAFSAARPAKGDAFLISTGWGDKRHPQAEGNEYILGSPHFSFDAARTLAQALYENENDLLLTDTAVLGLPKAHIIPEWFSMLPAASAESAEARMYLHLYDSDKAKKDFAVEMEFARAGITTVRKLVECRRIKNQRVKLMVSPLNIVRGVASTCRVVAVEE